jgi:hypothetical protein
VPLFRAPRPPAPARASRPPPPPPQAGGNAPAASSDVSNAGDVVQGSPYTFTFQTTSSNPVDASYTTTCGDPAPVSLGTIPVGGSVTVTYDFSRAAPVSDDAVVTCDITLRLVDTVNNKTSAVTHSVSIYPTGTSCTRAIDWLDTGGQPRDIVACSPLETSCARKLQLRMSCASSAALRGLLLGSIGGAAVNTSLSAPAALPLLAAANASSSSARRALAALADGFDAASAAAAAPAGLAFSVEVDWGDGSSRVTKPQVYDGANNALSIALDHTYTSSGRFQPQAWLVLVRPRGAGVEMGRRPAAAAVPCCLRAGTHYRLSPPHPPTPPTAFPHTRLDPHPCPFPPPPPSHRPTASGSGTTRTNSTPFIPRTPPGPR